jgi:hypothetical protein
MAFVIDNDMANVNPVQEELTVNVSFSFKFTLEQYGVHPGSRTFTFYAADSDVNAASPLTFSRTVVAPTPTVRDTPSESRPTHTAGRECAIAVTYALWSCNLIDTDVNAPSIATSFGYSSRLSVGDSSAMDRIRSLPMTRPCLRLTRYRDFCNWTQTTENAVNVADSSCSFSWRGISLLPGQSAAVSAIATESERHTPLPLAAWLPSRLRITSDDPGQSPFAGRDEGFNKRIQ